MTKNWPDFLLQNMPGTEAPADVRHLPPLTRRQKEAMKTKI
jgi:hypothetical protein